MFVSLVLSLSVKLRLRPSGEATDAEVRAAIEAVEDDR